MKKCSIKLIRDDEAGVWVAVNNRIPLALEAETLDDLIMRTVKIAPEILAENGLGDTRILFSFWTECKSRVRV
jgi:hypothetical protein